MTTPTTAIVRQKKGGYEARGALPKELGAEGELDFARFSNVNNIIDKPAMDNWRVRRSHEFHIEKHSVISSLLADTEMLPDQLEQSITDLFETWNSRSAYLGSAVHRVAEAYLRGVPFKKKDESRPEVMAYLPTIEAFVKDFAIEPIHIEAPLIHSKLWVAGCTDLIAKTSQLGVAGLDYKTSTRTDYSPYGAKVDNFIQGVFYKSCDWLLDQTGREKPDWNVFEGRFIPNVPVENIAVVNIQPPPEGYAVTIVKPEHWEELFEEFTRRKGAYDFSKTSSKLFHKNPPLLGGITATNDRVA